MSLRRNLAYWFRHKPNYVEMLTRVIEDHGLVSFRKTAAPAEARKAGIIYYLVVLAVVLLIYYYKYEVLIRGKFYGK